MLEDLFTLNWFFASIAADTIIRWKMPVGATLLHVSLSTTAKQNTTIKIGDGDDDDVIYTDTALPDNTQSELDLDNFVGAVYHPLVKGDVFTITLTKGSTSATMISIVCTFLAGGA
jgi:hypothetical protein